MLASRLLDANGDPYWNGVKSLCHFDGANGSTTFVDQRGNPITPSGNVNISTTNYKFGGSSAYFDGAGDYLTFAQSSALEPAANDFAYEFFFIPTDSSRRALFAYSADYSIGMDYNYNGTRNVNMWVSSNGTSWNMINSDSGGNGIGAISLTLNVPNHIVFCRIGNTFRSIVNGTIDKTVTVSGTIYTTSRSLRLGIWGNGGYNLLGYLDEFRFTKGVGRYASNFTPPAYPFKNA